MTRNKYNVRLVSIDKTSLPLCVHANRVSQLGRWLTRSEKDIKDIG